MRIDINFNQMKKFVLLRNLKERLKQIGRELERAEDAGNLDLFNLLCSKRERTKREIKELEAV